MWQKYKKNVCKRNKKTLPLLNVVQLHAWCPRNGFQGNSEYAIQFSGELCQRFLNKKRLEN